MPSNFEKCMAGLPFDGSDPELYAITLRAKRLLRSLNQLDYDDDTSRCQILAQLFGSIGDHVHIDIDFHCEYGRNIHIGSHVIINMNCTFVDNNTIRIGNNVLIASDVHIYTATHSTDPAERILPPGKGFGFCQTYSQPVTIEDDVWIGGATTILPGLTIGKGSTIGAGSVVTHSIPPHTVAVGNPCRVIKNLPIEP